MRDTIEKVNHQRRHLLDEKLHGCSHGAKPKTEDSGINDLKSEMLVAADGVKTECWHTLDQHDPTHCKPVVVIFHGRGCSLNSRSTLNRIKYFASQGHPVISYDYRGYGNSEQGDVLNSDEDARACIEFVKAKGFDPSQIVCLGWSAGTGPASKMAAEFQTKALMIQFPYKVMRECFTGMRHLTEYSAETYRYVREYCLKMHQAGRTPEVHVAHGKKDKITSFDKTLQILDNLSDLRDPIRLRFDIHCESGHMNMRFHGKGGFANDATEFLMRTEKKAIKANGLSVTLRQGVNNVREKCERRYIAHALSSGLTADLKTSLRGKPKLLNQLEALNIRRFELLRDGLKQANYSGFLSIKNAGLIGRLIRAIEQYYPCGSRAKFGDEKALFKTLSEILSDYSNTSYASDSASVKSCQQMLALMSSAILALSSPKFLLHESKFSQLYRLLAFYANASSRLRLDVHMRALCYKECTEENKCYQLLLLMKDDIVLNDELYGKVRTWEAAHRVSATPFYETLNLVERIQHTCLNMNTAECAGRSKIMMQHAEVIRQSIFQGSSHNYSEIGNIHHGNWLNCIRDTARLYYPQFLQVFDDPDHPLDGSMSELGRLSYAMTTQLMRFQIAGIKEGQPEIALNSKFRHLLCMLQSHRAIISKPRLVLDLKMQTIALLSDHISDEQRCERLLSRMLPAMNKRDLSGDHCAKIIDWAASQAIDLLPVNLARNINRLTYFSGELLKNKSSRPFGRSLSRCIDQLFSACKKEQWPNAINTLLTFLINNQTLSHKIPHLKSINICFDNLKRLVVKRYINHLKASTDQLSPVQKLKIALYQWSQDHDVSITAQDLWLDMTRIEQRTSESQATTIKKLFDHAILKASTAEAIVQLGKLLDHGDFIQPCATEESKGDDYDSADEDSSISRPSGSR